MLSIISTIYDPLGLESPFVLEGNCFKAYATNLSYGMML